MFTRKAQTALTARKQQEMQARIERRQEAERQRPVVAPAKGYIAVNGILMPY